MLNSFLEKEYRPSAWSKRFETSEEVISSHIKFVLKESEKNRQCYKTRLNIGYGPGKNETLDIYSKGEETGSPIFVYIHGGCWQELSKDVSAYCVQPIVEAGYRVVIVGYDLCPQVSLEELVVEIKRAGDYILQYAKETKASSIVYAGHSAGGHLLASLMKEEKLMSPLIKAVVFISGMFDLTELWRTSEINKDNILSLSEGNIKELSPIFADYQHITRSNTALKICIYVAEYDSPTFIRMSNDFCKHLESFGLVPEYAVLQGLDHFNIVEKLSETEYKISRCILNELNK